MAENKQEHQKTRYELETEIKEELMAAWEKKNGPIQVELTDKQKEEKKKRIKEDGFEWDENRDGFEYTSAGRDFIYGIHEESLDQQVDKIFGEKYGSLGGGEDEEFNLAPPSDSIDEVDQRDSLKLNSSDELGLDKDLSSAELEGSFLSVPGSDLSGELSEDALNGNSSIKTPEDQDRRSQIIDLEELNKRFQETHRYFVGDLYKGIEENVITRFEDEHGPIKRELNNEEKKRKKKAIEEGGTWDEFEDGIEYTDAGKKFLFGKGTDSLENLADAEFLKDHPYYADDLKSWKETRANLKEHENIEESEQISEAGETLVNAGETLIEKAKEKRERDPDLPKSKKLAETLENLDDQGKIEFLQKFRGIKSSVLVEGENGARERQYIRLKDGEEFNLNGKEELTFEFFDKYGDIILNEDGSPKTKTQKISDIKYRDWKPYDFYHIGEKNHYYNDVLEKIDDDNFNYANSVVYENEVTDKNIRVMRRMTESRGYTEQEAEEWKKLLDQHESLLKELESSYSLARDNFKEVENEKHAAFFEERLKEIVNYKKSEIVEAIKAGDVSLSVISREIEVLKSLLETYKKTEEKFDFRVPEKLVENNSSVVQEAKNVEVEENAEDNIEAIEEEISRLIDNYSNLSAKQKLALKNNETILVSSWPATIEMNRYQIATCVYQGVDVTTIKVKGFVPLISETITFSLMDANKTKQELSWHDFFNTIDANYRDNLLPAIKSHLKGKAIESSESPVEMELVEPPLKDNNNSGEQEKLDEKKEEGDSEKPDQKEVVEAENSRDANDLENKDGKEVGEDAQSEELEKLDKAKKEAINYVTREDILDILFEHEDEFDYSPDEMLTLPVEDAQELYQKIADKVNGMKTVEEVQNYRKVLEGIIGKHLKDNKSPEKSQEEKEKELKDLKLKIKTFLLAQSNKKIDKIKDKKERVEAQKKDDKFMKETFEDIDKEIDIKVLEEMYQSITSE